MKKILVLLALGIFGLFLLSGCGKKEEPKTETQTMEEQTEQPMEDTMAAPDTTTMPDTTAMEGESEGSY